MLRPLLPALALVASVATAADPFPLRSGDVVAFVGNTFVEREQRDGYLELALTLSAPNADVAFRNLGWSGDTVNGRARRFFGPTEDGFKHLLEHLDVVKPTVVLVCYGTNEAFDGKSGRAAFVEGYERLLDELAKRTPRIALMSAPPLDPSKSPAPAVARAVNEELRGQTEAVRELAGRKGFEFIDLFGGLEKSVPRWSEVSRPMTDNGLHYTSFGYATAGDVLLDALPAAGAWRGADHLEGDAYPHESPLERLRAAIVEKNALFFHRHRPQNETYLRGFRKHEQGNNATEIYALEPLVAQKDREVFALRKAALPASANAPR